MTPPHALSDLPLRTTLAPACTTSPSSSHAVRRLANSGSRYPPFAAGAAARAAAGAARRSPREPPRVALRRRSPPELPRPWTRSPPEPPVALPLNLASAPPPPVLKQATSI
ncbi:hypothetical protein ACQJBY_060003 [Aegilops geniculata]